MSTADHMPTHRTARDTDDAGHVWLHQGRSDFWGPQTPGRDGGSSTPVPLPAPGRVTNAGKEVAAVNGWVWGP